MPASSNNPNSESSQRQSYSGAHGDVMDAFERRWSESNEIPFESAVVAGKSPFRRGKILSYLWDLEIETKYLGDIDAPDLLVLGRTWVEGREKDGVERLLKNRQGKQLRICSQEMLLAWAMTGVDPNERIQTVETFIEGHPALEFVEKILEDRWPGTDPIPFHGDGEAEFDRPDKSPLKHFGYSVGESGNSRSQRRSALEKTYVTERESLPGTYPDEYISEWGPAESGARLQRIAGHLASNCRTFHQRDRNYQVAISDWEDDLRWLKETFYNPLSYGFEWPEAK